MEWFSNLRTQKSIESSDVSVLMIDAKIGPTSRDKKIAATIVNAEKGCLILVNKWDLSEEEDEVTQTKYLPALRKSLPFLSFPFAFLFLQKWLQYKAINRSNRLCCRPNSNRNFNRHSKSHHSTISRKFTSANYKR